MKWVKASERTPEYDDYKRIHINIISSGKRTPEIGRFVGRFIGDSKGSLNAAEVEWLDEGQPLPEEGWISVRDRLPSDEKSNSIYCLVHDSYYGIVVRPFNQAHMCWDDEDADDFYTDAKNGKITHWQPLPPLPKTDKP